MSDYAVPIRQGSLGNPHVPAPVPEVRVVGFSMPFFNVIGFFKAAPAAVPAATIVVVIWLVLAPMLGGLFAGLVVQHV